MFVFCLFKFVYALKSPKILKTKFELFFFKFDCFLILFVFVIVLKLLSFPNLDFSIIVTTDDISVRING